MKSHKGMSTSMGSRNRTVVKSKALPATPPPSEASRDFAKQPKSKAIKDPKVGYGGSKNPRVND